jgi:hypothetical protein
MRKTSCILLLVALAAAHAARADTLIMQTLEESRATADARPARGMSMSSVSARWGEPASKAAPVGQPPITRWEYGDFVVFFEYDHVIHAVTRHR